MGKTVLFFVVLIFTCSNLNHCFVNTDDVCFEIIKPWPVRLASQIPSTFLSGIKWSALDKFHLNPQFKVLIWADISGVTAPQKKLILKQNSIVSQSLPCHITICYDESSLGSLSIGDDWLSATKQPERHMAGTPLFIE